MWWVVVVALIIGIIFVVTICALSSNERGGFVFSRHKEKDLNKIYDMRQIYNYQNSKKK